MAVNRVRNTPASGNPMSSTDNDATDAVRWFGVPARTLILAAIALYAAGTLGYRMAFPAPPEESYSRVVGRLYSDLVFHLGAPDRIEPLQDGKMALHYDEVVVKDGVFARSHFKILIDRYSRAYAFERD